MIYNDNINININNEIKNNANNKFDEVNILINSKSEVFLIEKNNKKTEDIKLTDNNYNNYS